MRDAEDVVLEDLKRVLAAQAAARDDEREILSRLARINRCLDRVSRDRSSNYPELVKSRRALERLRQRVTRIEHRLEETQR